MNLTLHERVTCPVSSVSVLSTHAPRYGPLLEGAARFTRASSRVPASVSKSFPSIVTVIFSLPTTFPSQAGALSYFFIIHQFLVGANFASLTRRSKLRFSQNPLCASSVGDSSQRFAPPHAASRAGAPVAPPLPRKAAALRGVVRVRLRRMLRQGFIGIARAGSLRFKHFCVCSRSALPRLSPDCQKAYYQGVRGCTSLIHPTTCASDWIEKCHLKAAF